MRLTKKHIGKLIGSASSDGEWAMYLLDIKDNKILFADYDLTGDEAPRYWAQVNRFDDWVPFKKKLPNKKTIKGLWKTAKLEP